MTKEMRNHQSGFTLLETLIYLAVFSIVIGGGIIASFYIVDSGQKEKGGVNLQAAGNFILRKFEWAMAGASGISVASPTTLSVEKDTSSGFPAAQNPLVFSLNGPNLELKRGTGAAAILNSTNAAVASLTFTATGTTPQGIEVRFTLSSGNSPKSQTFTVTKYLRK